jgi:predicted O-linked N-acetylglucosamine transferase (SPINDLY family)
MEQTTSRLLGEAIRLHRAGDRAAAQRLYRQIVERDPAHADAWHLLGVAASQDGAHEQALALFDRAIALDPANPAAYQNRGLALHAARRIEAALADFTRATDLDPGFAAAHSNRGLALLELGRFEEALPCLEAAVALDARLAEAHYNLGNAMQKLRRTAEAVESYDRALALEPRFAAAWSNRGHALQALGRVGEAVDSLERALALDPSMPFLQGLLLFAKLESCDWSGLEAAVAGLADRVAAGEAVAPPFALLAMRDDPALHRRAAEIYVGARHPESHELGPIAPRGRGARIRVGYFSGDFREHSVAYLTAGVFEAHDRSRFEVCGFSFGPASAGPMRERLSRAFDRFIDVASVPDRDVAALARSLAIDIAVDLGGHTKEARTGIFARRAAPVQASYAGYLGTMGAPYYDYLFADRTLVERSESHDYSERIVTLPCYQANDAQRSAAERHFTRDELGLPAGAIAFCCLNNAYKINPRIFASWMRILERVPAGVLALYAADATAATNLRKHAAAAGVDPERVLFAQRLPRPEYLSRLRSFDLFLDTYPYGAGTVASDALWSGLPVLARAGNAFQSRMAASLLEAIGLPELACGSDGEYEDLAVALALDPAMLAGVRGKLECNRAATRLFDVRAFTRSLEQAYALMHERLCAGLPPQALVIPSARP